MFRKFCTKCPTIERRTLTSIFPGWYSVQSVYCFNPSHDHDRFLVVPWTEPMYFRKSYQTFGLRTFLDSKALSLKLSILSRIFSSLVRSTKGVVWSRIEPNEGNATLIAPRFRHHFELYWQKCPPLSHPQIYEQRTAAPCGHNLTW